MICRAGATTTGRKCPPVRPWTISETAFDQDVALQSTIVLRRHKSAETGYGQPCSMGKNACPAQIGSGLPRHRRGLRVGVPNAVRPCFADHPKAKRVPPLAAGPRPWTLGVRTAEALGTRPRLVRDPAMASQPPT
jgi:hypothetical protein